MGINYVDRTIKVSAPQPTVTLDPDKYLGTIGLSDDKPTGSPAPHYTAFPEDARTGNWLQVVSEFTLGGQLLLRGEEWYCFRAKTDTQASVWTRSQAGEKQPAYVSVAQNIGEYRAFLYNNEPLLVKNRESTYIYWGNIFSTGIYRGIDNRVKTSILDITPGLKPHIEHDFYIFTQFANDKTGVRQAVVNTYSYYPEKDNRFAVGLEEFEVRNLSRGPLEPLEIIRPDVILPTTEPLDDTELYYGLSAYVVQNSERNLNLIYAELKFKSRYKIY